MTNYTVKVVLYADDLNGKETENREEHERITAHFRDSIHSFLSDFDDLPKIEYWFTGTGLIKKAELMNIEIDSLNKELTFYLDGTLDNDYEAQENKAF